MFKWIRAILLLPVMVIVVVPTLILYVSDYHFVQPAWLYMALAIVVFSSGITFALWTMYLFNTLGKGTAAPWDPPKHFVLSGPYRYMRNPMITSVFMMLWGEVLFLKSIFIMGWLIVFWLLNLIYIRMIEEPELAKRFGVDYKLYKKNVPRWIPRLKPWDLPK